MLSASDGEGQNLLAWASKQTTDGFTRTADYVQKIAPEKVKRTCSIVLSMIPFGHSAACFSPVTRAARSKSWPFFPDP